MNEGTPAAIVPISEVADWYRSLPEGAPTSCYHCGREGELSGPPFSGLCMDRDDCYQRQLVVRMDVWEEGGSLMGYCAACREHGALLASHAGAMCVDYRSCNERRCERHGHQAGVEERQCLTGDFAEAMENIGRNRWRLFRACVLCHEIVESRTYSEAESVA
ncbi:MAG: hypothetical protein QOF83_3702 [Solirubrobacteraceae bacterium]|nr:hypothetical protein [Solirubrobacteraceae bacterium]